MSTTPRRTRAGRLLAGRFLAGRFLAGRWRARLRVVVGMLAAIAAVATFNLAAQAVEAVDDDGDAADLDADQAELLAQGEQVYGNQCVMCHGRDARGAEDLGPSLANQGGAAMDFVIPGMRVLRGRRGPAGVRGRPEQRDNRPRRSPRCSWRCATAARSRPTPTRRCATS